MASFTVASADEFEHVFNRMYDLSNHAPFDIKSTAAPQYRRVILQRQVAERRRGERQQPPSHHGDPATARTALGAPMRAAISP